MTKRELEYCQWLISTKYVKNAWIVGGSLLREDSKDIDILAQYSFDADEIVDPIKVLDIPLDTVVEGVYEQYHGASPVDEGGDFVIKLVPEPFMCRPIDVLGVSTQMTDGGISEYMKKWFPLSIQCIAKSLFTGEVIDDSNQHSDIVFASELCSNKYLTKYKGYYPDKKFYRITLL